MASFKQQKIISKIDGKEYIPGRWFSRHLAEHGINSYQEYYERYPDLYATIPKCKYCDNKVRLKKYFPMRPMGNTCSDKECKNKAIAEGHNNRTEEQVKNANIKRIKTVSKVYGCEYVSQNKDTINKQLETKSKIDEKTGKTIQQLNTEAIQKAKEEKYGDKFYNNSKKISETKQNFSIDKNNEINEKRRKTNLEVYGVENTFHLPNVFTKTRKGNASIKMFTLPSGKIIKIRGYEPTAITELLTRYNENELVICDETDIMKCGIPVFEYKNVHGNINKYYPDIFIPKENKIIEVKSRWWYDAYNREGYESRIKNNNRKRQACLDKNYKFEFWIYETDNSKTVI